MAMTSNLINLLQIILMSIGAIFITITIIILSLYLNPLLSSAISEVPNLWLSFKSWLRPPYLYFIINCIIITIAATSRHHHAPPPPRADNLSSYDAVESGYETASDKDVEMEEVEKRIVEEVKSYDDDRFLKDDQIGGEREESTVSETATWIVKQKSLDASPEKEMQMVSSKSGHRRIPARVHPRGGKLLRVAKPNKHETMDNIWKAITEGKQNPSTRQMNQSDTWKNHSRHINLLDDVSPVMKKSETFKDRSNYLPPPVTSTRLKKEPSPSQDELNQRVEAFINKFNENMRLQRQESMQQFMDKINRAA